MNPQHGTKVLLNTLGEFKNDQFEDHTHSMSQYFASGSGLYTTGGGAGRWATTTGNANTGRHGTTTHGKQLGVNFIIKY